eukprot:6193041-Pleurochrysis_carterae.AAC.2
MAAFDHVSRVIDAVYKDLTQARARPSPTPLANPTWRCSSETPGWSVFCCGCCSAARGASPHISLRQCTLISLRRCTLLSGNVQPYPDVVASLGCACTCF